MTPSSTETIKPKEYTSLPTTWTRAVSIALTRDEYDRQSETVNNRDVTSGTSRFLRWSNNEVVFHLHLRPRRSQLSSVDLHGVEGQLVLIFDQPKHTGDAIWRKPIKEFQPGELDVIMRGLADDLGADLKNTHSGY